jgi:hypothetical protein
LSGTFWLPRPAGENLTQNGQAVRPTLQSFARTGTELPGLRFVLAVEEELTLERPAD